MTNNDEATPGTTTTAQRRRKPAAGAPPPPDRRRWLLSLLLAAASAPPAHHRRPAAAEALQVTTFNVLAAVHRSMPPPPPAVVPAPLSGREDEAPRESERREWWGPRAEGLARYVARELAHSDAVLLQEWWFSPEFEELFDRHTAHIFDRAAERRPGREDGMAVLINKRGKLELVESGSVLTGPQRIAQIAQCRERGAGAGAGRGRRVTIANAHLSFPGGPDPVANVRRQAMEVQIAARALDRAVSASASTLEGSNGLWRDDVLDDDNDEDGGQSHLQIIGGDFNSNSLSLPALKLESPKWGYVNSATATAALTMASGSIGGNINLGVTHRTHRGEDVSVDHIFARTAGSRDGQNAEGAAARGGRGTASGALRGLGYLDDAGTRISFCRKRRLHLQGDGMLSDHRPVTTVFEWPPETTRAEEGRVSEWRRATVAFSPLLATTAAVGGGGLGGGMEPASLHPLQSPWDTP